MGAINGLWPRYSAALLWPVKGWNKRQSQKETEYFYSTRQAQWAYSVFLLSLQTETKSYPQL